ncbi:MAG: hypothetical protein GXX96_10475 [Planctomycetaceae bacterium]|nr:hypothetical protein [Planctomycetaceae bacterium]
MSITFLAAEPDPQLFVVVAVAVFLIVAMFFMIMVMVIKYYKRCPSNRILVILGRTGPGERCQCIHGGGRLVIPVFQDYRWLSLDAIRVEISGPAASDELAERLFLPNVFNVAIGTTPDLMQHAAKHLLDRTQDEIRQLAEDAIAGRLDHALADQRSRPSDDSAAVLDSLSKAIESDLNQLGLTLLNSRRT